MERRFLHKSKLQIRNVCCKTREVSSVKNFGVTEFTPIIWADISPAIFVDSRMRFTFDCGVPTRKTVIFVSKISKKS
jgi:hypothetical protein